MRLPARCCDDSPSPPFLPASDPGKIDLTATVRLQAVQTDVAGVLRIDFSDAQIQSVESYLDTAAMARQLGMMGDGSVQGREDFALVPIGCVVLKLSD